MKFVMAELAFGEKLVELLIDREKVESYLKSEDWLERMGAIELLDREFQVRPSELVAHRAALVADVAARRVHLRLPKRKEYPQVEEIIFGDRLHALKQNRKQTESLLNSDNPKERFGALLLLAKHFELSTEVLDAVCQDLAGDEDEQVRLGALYYGSKRYHQTRDPDALRKYALIALDDGRAEKFRLTAVQVVYRIWELPPKLKPLPLIPPAPLFETANESLEETLRFNNNRFDEILANSERLCRIAKEGLEGVDWPFIQRLALSS